ncbi:class I SAM-dependent methyltransferase [Nannocystis pusilla]|uniref:Class I SAM-dependent methyltransferase n=1 Tax=Nannocystis pusilla TaxID=889268 RepID=A0A9X3J2T5_9BACT|nr:class I SAM-dependent methyltransferase [Nannocystis pusilla]MCY1012505.1 class I SAM-dependent methyltransferase [Nannocystis pusilla]
MKLPFSLELSPPGAVIGDPRVQAVLKRLHGAAAGQRLQIVRRFVPALLRGSLLRRRPSAAEMSEIAKDLYLPLSPEQGALCYLVARALGARRIVEFGTSFGISTIYFAAAVRDNGGGLVIGTELVPEKVAQARANLREAGLEAFAEIREGDALQTLQGPLGAIDMMLLDGWKDLYLPIIRMLGPQVRPGGVVIGDNIFTFKRDLAPYVAYMQDPANGFRSSTLHLADGTEFSVRV